ncbi:MAG TPA: glycoside hydrolase family 2, partial [Flavobacterium sp.]|nr:glycoside hydrolase family 2 [Flavobacterium sp.]
MNILKHTRLLLLLLVMGSCSSKKDIASQTNTINFNEDWFFKMADNPAMTDDAYLKNTNFSSWDAVVLPHTPKIEPKIVNNQWQGISWYVKKFSLAEAMKGKKLFLKFDAAMNIAEVWINNKKLIEHHGGYLPFVVDFSSVALFDKENTVSVKLNNFDNPVTGPKPLKTLDFNTYGGIYRNVWLIAKNSLHITDPIFTNKTASGGVFVSYPKVNKQEATINVKTHVLNQIEEDQSFVIKNTLLKNDKEILSKTSEAYILKSNQDQQFSADLILKNPELWSPNAPNLYHLKTEIIQNGAVVDHEITRIGIKHIEFVGQDLFWNGEKTFLRGVNRHQEYPYVGYALSDNANYRDAKKIKNAGFDYVRLSHYPQSTSFMNACDELGIVTIDAILGWQYFSEDKAFQENVFQSAKELIRRDRNHASVLALA